MDWLGDAWRWLMAQYVNWELLLRFLEVLIWPLITLVGLVMVQPGRIITALLDGGEISAGPATFKFRQKLDQVAATVDAGSEAADEGIADEGIPPEPAAQPRGDSDPYTTVMNGWGLVTETLASLAQLAGLPAHRKIKPLDTVEALLDAGLIDRKLQRSIEQLFEYRNSVRTTGSARAERRGLTQDVAEEYFENADKVKRSLSITVKRRLGMGPKGGDRPSSQLN
ncbi:hypothetical protein U91I_02726 [alpha proteobacterium U9-1i]|nr:hypothetical protein U91I_02726 [alpha proteobacterium U9-1i]